MIPVRVYKEYKLSNLKKIVDVCNALNVDTSTVELYAGYKQVFFQLPDCVIYNLCDENGNYATEAYDSFCEEHGIWYDSEWECWAA